MLTQERVHAQAGGALFFNGSSPGSGLQLSQGLLSANAVHYDLKPGSEAGGTGGKHVP